MTLQLYARKRGASLHRQIYVFLAVASLILTAPAHANPLLQTLEFQAMRADGFSPATALIFANLAEQRGDQDSAIAALEQSLLQHEADPELHQRLADLYGRVGNEAMASHHAQHAINTTIASAAQIWGRVSNGIARDSNPTAAESDSEIRLFDAASNTFQNVLAREREPDTLATVSLDLGGSYELSEAALLAADLSVSAEKYFSTEELDTVSGALTIGPWLTLNDGQQGGTYLRPFVTGGTALLAGQHYYTTVGGGAEFRASLGDDQQLSLRASAQRTDYNGNVIQNFDANTLDHTSYSLSVGVFGNGPFDSTYSITSYAGLVDASSNSESYLFAGMAARANIPVPPVAEATGLPLSLQLGGSVDQFSYDAADPVIDPTQARQDLWLGADGALVLTVTDDVEIVFGAKYLRRMSNIAAFESDNLRIYTELGVNF